MDSPEGSGLSHILKANQLAIKKNILESILQRRVTLLLISANAVDAEIEERKDRFCLRQWSTRQPFHKTLLFYEGHVTGDNLTGKDGDTRAGRGGVIEWDGEAMVTEAEIRDGVPIPSDLVLPIGGGGGHHRRVEMWRRKVVSAAPQREEGPSRSTQLHGARQL